MQTRVKEAAVHPQQCPLPQSFVASNEFPALIHSCLTLAGQGEPKQAAPKQKRWGKSRPYFGTIVASEGLCNISGKDDKDTIRVEIDLGISGLSYLPGDALGILPLNCYEVSQPSPLISPVYLLDLSCHMLKGTENVLLYNSAF